MYELTDFVGHSSTGHREEVAVLNTDGLLQQGIDGLLIEFVLQVEHQRRTFTQAQIVEVMNFSHTDSILHQALLDSLFGGNLLVHPCIDLLPKAGHTAHQRGAHLLDGRSNLCRFQVETHHHSLVQAVVGPCTLEHVGQRQETHRHILVRHLRQADVVDADNLFIGRMVKQHALRLTRSTTGIEDIGQVVHRSTSGALGHHGCMGQSLAHLQELVEIDTGRVALVFLNLAVKENQFLQRRTDAQHTEGRIVLILFAHKKKADLCIVDDVLCLSCRTGGIKRNRDCPIGMSGKVGIQTFGLVL